MNTIHLMFQRLIILALMLSAGPCLGQYVELTAKIEIVNWNRVGASKEPWDVRCVVGTNIWEMEGLFLEGAKSKVWFTGTNLIQIDELPKPVGENERLLDYTDGPNRFIQIATPSGRRYECISDSADGNPGKPARQLDLITMPGRIAWLAFCSGPCLKREGRKIYPPSDLWKELVRAPVSDRTVVFEDGFGLPKSINLQVTNGFPVLQYGVSSSTNVCGWEFPQEFYLAQYRPAPSPNFSGYGPDGWEVDFIAKGTLVSIRPGSKPEIPAVTKK